MYSISNASLEVSILDPAVDRDRFGTRYCTGGYIFQIRDSRYGDLLTGPTFPDSFNPFDGQGIPDAFNLGPLRDPAGSDAKVLIIGVGLCDLQADQVLEFCQWDVELRKDRISLWTRQTFTNIDFRLERCVSLHGRTVRSTTCLHNNGGRPLAFRWFPHPFFPQTETDELCRLNMRVDFPENAGYELAENGFICRKGWPWDSGHYQALEHTCTGNLIILQRHPKLGLIGGTCSYIPTYLPIWGNPNTFSWEPFLESSVGAGQQRGWYIDYDF